LTEEGIISVELHNQIQYSTEPNSTFEKIEGSTQSGDEVILPNVVVTTSHQPGDSTNPHTISSVDYVNGLRSTGLEVLHLLTNKLKFILTYSI